MAIGDNWNDVGMLEWVGHSFIMGNASRASRSLAKLRGWKQAPSNDRNGVAVVLESAIARPLHLTAVRQPGPGASLEEDRT